MLDVFDCRVSSMAEVVRPSDSAPGGGQYGGTEAVSADHPFPIPPRKLDDRLAFVRHEARRVIDGDIVGHVDVMNAALRISHTLQLTRWTQRRYPHLTLSEAELAAIREFAERRWQSSGEQTTREVQRLAEALAQVGLSQVD